MNNKLSYGIKKFLKFLILLLAFIIALASCHLSGNKNRRLKFNPVLKKAYHFSLTKYVTKSWTYQSVPVKICDTVYLNFSLQNIHNRDNSFTCKLTWDKFIWQGKPKVNYIRDSSHALSTNVVLSDKGQVEYVQEMNEILQDIENDSSTGKYLSGVIPDQISQDAVTDMLNRIFSVIPAKEIATRDTWISNITLITNHPVNISNFNVLKSRNGDTSVIEIQSNVFARRSPGEEPYIQGNQKGSASVSHSTGMPFLYQTQAEIVTTTNYYDVKQVEKFILKME